MWYEYDDKPNYLFYVFAVVVLLGALCVITTR